MRGARPDVGTLDRGATGVRRAVLLRAWSDDVTLLADDPAELDAEGAERLRAIGIDSSFDTSVPGLCAAGDVSAPMPSVANAIEAGPNAAGTMARGLTDGTSDLSRR